MASPAKELTAVSLTKKQTIIDDVQVKIRTGEYPPGHKLPSNTDMQKIYVCSAEPVRNAIDFLKASGWLVSAPGLGVFVAAKPPS